jgi:Nitroreductase family
LHQNVYLLRVLLKTNWRGGAFALTTLILLAGILMNRRTILIGASVVAVSSKMPASAESSRPATYEEAVRLVWRPLDASGGAQEIARAGTLAANSHNTQPWRFTISTGLITIRPDFDRRCPAVDPDDHHLFASLGCAVENMMQAATTLGYKAEATIAGTSPERVNIAIEQTRQSGNELADAITKRQCTRAAYDGRTISAEDLTKIAHAGTFDGVECLLVTDRGRIEAILDYVVQGNTAQMRDQAFMTELVSWIRFNDSMAIEHLDGLSARSSSNPSLPAWIAKRLLPFVMTEKGENDKYAKQLRSSAGIAVFAASSNDRAGWIAAGRAYQRFALQATALDIRQAFINQPVEVASLRPQIASYLGIGERRPNLLVRFGRGPTLPPSLRRPVHAVIEQS